MEELPKNAGKFLSPRFCFSLLLSCLLDTLFDILKIYAFLCYRIFLTVCSFLLTTYFHFSILQVSDSFLIRWRCFPLPHHRFRTVLLSFLLSILHILLFFLSLFSVISILILIFALLGFSESFFAPDIVNRVLSFIFSFREGILRLVFFFMIYSFSFFLSSLPVNSICKSNSFLRLYTYRISALFFLILSILTIVFSILGTANWRMCLLYASVSVLSFYYSSHEK